MTAAEVLGGALEVFAWANLLGVALIGCASCAAAWRSERAKASPVAKYKGRPLTFSVIDEPKTKKGDHDKSTK